MKVQLVDVIEAIEDADEQAAAAYDTAAQQIVWDGDDDNENLIPLPGREERGDYRNMQRFIETVDDEEAQEWLGNAIRGAGAFRRFRAACEKFHLLEDWYHFEDRAHRALAVQWCEDNGIVWDDAEPIELVDEDDVSDFLHEDYQEEEKEPEPAPVQPSVYRIVEITDKNLMNALYITDAYLQAAYHSPSDLEYAQDQLELWLEEGCSVIAASDHGRFVGIASGKEDLEDFTVKAVFVNEDHRRKGIGRMMIKYFEDNHQDTSSYRLELDNKSTGAAAFFDHIGYQALPVIIMRKVPSDQ